MMNRIVKISLITSLAMLLLLGGAAFLLFQKGKQATEDARENEKQELDMLYEGSEKVDLGKEGDRIPLSTKGKNANVKTFTYRNVSAIYDVSNSKKAAEQIDIWKKKGKYSIESPLWVWNPYGTNNLSMYLYFPTQEMSSLRYTISVDDETIPDFTRRLNTNNSTGQTTKQEYLLTGFLPGRTNYIVLERFNASGERTGRQVFVFDVPGLSSGAEVRMEAVQGKSRQMMSNGLFCLCGVEDKTGNMLPYIWLYDNSGILRGEIPIKNYRTDRISIVGDEMVYSYGKKNFARISRMGQVLSVYDLGIFEQHHDFIYNGYGSLWILATDSSKKNHASGDVVVSLNLNSGDVIKLLDFEKILKQRFRAALRKAEKKNAEVGNWISLNSIQQLGSTDILVSSDKFSTIMKVSDVTSAVPKLSYLIADSNLWELEKPQKKLFSMIGPESEADSGDKNTDSNTEDKTQKVDTEEFLPQYGQNYLGCEEIQNQDSKEEETQADREYYLSMFNNNYKDGKDGDTSYYYRYLVKEADQTYELKDEFKVPYSRKNGSLQRYKGQFVCAVSEDAEYLEYDKSGLMIYQYALKNKKRVYRVQKEDFKGFWFW